MHLLVIIVKMNCVVSLILVRLKLFLAYFHGHIIKPNESAFVFFLYYKQQLLHSNPNVRESCVP